MVNIADMNYEQKKLQHVSAAANLLAVKTSGGILWAIRVQNDAGGAQYIQVHDTAAAPSVGAAPVEVFKVGAGEAAIYPFAYGRRMNNGIHIVNSTTMATYTAGANDCWLSAAFE